ncbi:hypothetical protein J7T55_013858 [Diaporthe amygdali]|uniref:uncharacterized protein n=1 Tax=Phomopsis amygdali TaxID=1214568 RepID=UPI0022FF05E4|nr:uncharacterized protein J7T55_013858 [Diaporthe amygdali]KAJ0119655.1 hypothetical protein J7T55_013858 [Diaporthe amygdali]
MRPTISLAALLGSAFTTATASRGNMTSPDATIIPGAYIVEFLDGNDHTSFYGSLRANDINVSPRMNMTFKLFNGVSFSITNLTGHTKTASKISVMPSVKNIWPMHRYPAPGFQRSNTTSYHNPQDTVDFVSEPDNATAIGTGAFSPHVMTQVDRLHELGYTGKGSRIAIVDSGVDYYHPALGGCFGEGCLIASGYDLAGESYDGTSAPQPKPDPYDNCDGHGTHVAGIIGARPNPMGFIGAAPGATLAMYKVFSCTGMGTTEDLLISAFNMAFDDGNDIITASIGGPGGWSEGPWSLAVGRIVENGVPCTLAAGNDGIDGMWTPSKAADGKGVTAVSSFDNIKTPYLLSKGSYSTNASSSESCPGSKSFGWLPGSPPLGNISMPLWATSHDPTVEDDACARLPAETPDLSDFIVLIRMTTACEGYIQQYYTGYTKGTGVVSPEQGLEWVDLLSRGSDVHLTLIDPSNSGYVPAEVQNNLTGGFASWYTSWGPTLELDVYPSVGAPGGKILSTYLLNQGGYSVLSGTSMATPLIAAVYALVGQVRGTYDPKELAMALSSTSQAQLWNDGFGTINGVAPVPQQGAGLVQAYDAAFLTTHLSTKGISFNDTVNLRNVTFTIQNLGSESVTYELGNRPALTMNTLFMNTYYPQSFPNTIIAATADIEFSQSLVTLPPKGRAEITVTPTFAAQHEILDGLLPVYSGYITINGTNDENSVIPYLGVLGSMMNAFVMDQNDDEMLGFNFACAEEGERPTYPDNITFDLPYPTMENVPEILDWTEIFVYPSAEFSLNFGTRVLRADVIPLSANYTGPTTTVLGETIAGSAYGFPQYYLPRYPSWVLFDGMLADGSVVPEGRYALDIKALKLFGDPDDLLDYESLPKIPFTISYQDGPNNTGRMEGRL